MLIVLLKLLTNYDILCFTNTLYLIHLCLWYNEICQSITENISRRSEKKYGMAKMASIVVSWREETRHLGNDVFY